jgi:Collagen triple helix repeat (20 copies)
VTPAKLSIKAKATLRGQTGATGAAGPKGATGSQGPRGEAGSKGERGEIGPSTIYAGFHDEFVSLTTKLPARSPVATLTGLPAGSYAISAKFLAKGYAEKTTDFTECVLRAETDTDTAYQYLGNGPGGIFSDIFSMQIVHTFPAVGAATIECGHTLSASENIEQIKITAVKVGSIATNHGI